MGIVGANFKSRNLGAATADGAALVNAGACIAKKLIIAVGATPRFYKFYDKATAPSQADTPILCVYAPVGTTVVDLGPDGIACALGLGHRSSVGGTDADVVYTSFAAGDSSVTVVYAQMA